MANQYTQQQQSRGGVLDLLNQAAFTTRKLGEDLRQRDLADKMSYIEIAKGTLPMMKQAFKVRQEALADRLNTEYDQFSEAMDNVTTEADRLTASRIDKPDVLSGLVDISDKLRSLPEVKQAIKDVIRMESNNYREKTTSQPIYPVDKYGNQKSFNPEKLSDFFSNDSQWEVKPDTRPFEPLFDIVNLPSNLETQKYSDRLLRQSKIPSPTPDITDKNLRSNDNINSIANLYDQYPNVKKYADDRSVRMTDRFREALNGGK